MPFPVLINRWPFGRPNGIIPVAMRGKNITQQSACLGHRGSGRVGWAFTFAAAAYNLVRLPKLIAQTG
jgi:hypothetical protein